MVAKKRYTRSFIVSISHVSPLFLFTIKTLVSFPYCFLLCFNVILSNQTVHEVLVWNITPRHFSIMSLGSTNESRGLPAGWWTLYDTDVGTGMNALKIVFWSRLGYSISICYSCYMSCNLSRYLLRVGRKLGTTCQEMMFLGTWLLAGQS